MENPNVIDEKRDLFEAAFQQSESAITEITQLQEILRKLERRVIVLEKELRTYKEKEQQRKDLEFVADTLKGVK